MITANKIYTDSYLHSRSPAYCKGFVDGYNEGVYRNPYDGAERESNNHLLYKVGYDAGVNEYCNQNHPEE